MYLLRFQFEKISEKSKIVILKNCFQNRKFSNRNERKSGIPFQFSTPTYSKKRKRCCFITNFIPMFSGSSLCSKHWILNCSVQNKRLRWNMACLDHLHGLENICRDLEVLLFNLYISEIRIDIRRPKLIGIAICRMGTGTGPWRYLRARSWTSNV